VASVISTAFMARLRSAAADYRRDAGLARLDGRGARPWLERAPDGRDGAAGASAPTSRTSSASDTRDAARAQS
jgi:hypothetical protein